MRRIFSAIFSYRLWLPAFVFVTFFGSSNLAFADEYIEVRGQVGSIVAGPSSEDTSDSDNDNDDDSQKKKSSFTSTAAPDFSAWPANFNGALFDTQNGVARFTIARPAFEGKTNIQNAHITLVFKYGVFSLRSTTQADASGDWKWASPADFPNGNFQLNLQAQHPKENSIKKEVALSFDVAADKNGIFWNEQFLENGSQLPFDLLVSIQEQYRKVAPGENIVASIRMVNFTIPTSPLDVMIEYSIQDEEGKEIFYQQETLAVNKELSYVKAFYTQPDMPEGTYRLIVKMPSSNTLAVASAEFIIAGEKELFITPFAKVDYSLILKGVGIIFFLFILLSYFEFIRFLHVKKHIHFVTTKLLKKFF